MSTILIALLSSSIGIISALITEYLTSYSKTKAQNKAMKEDLEKITEITESVKTQLSILTNKKNQIFEEQKKIIIEFTIKYNSSFWYLFEKPLNQYNLGNLNMLKEREEKFIKNKVEIFDTLSVFTLFVSDPPIINHALELNKKLVNAVSIHRNDLKKYEKILTSLNYYTDENGDEFDYINDPEEQIEFDNLKKEKKLLLEKQTEFYELSNEINKLRKEYIKVVNNFLHKD